MPFIAKVPGLFRRAPIVLILVFGLVALLPGRSDAVVRALIKVADTTAPDAQLNTIINVFMQNYFGPGTGDTIAGFKIYLQLDNPDIMKFQGDSGIAVDTTYWKCNSYSGPTCVDSTLTIPSDDWDFFNVDTSNILIGNFQTAGTLISSWQYVTSRSLAGNGSDILLIGIADDPFVSGVPAPIYPQTSNTPLIKLLADVNHVPDSLTGDDRKTNIVIQTDFVNNFGLSKPNGKAIGIAYQQYVDSNYYVCNQWAGSVCVGGWTPTSTPPYDSIAVVPDSFPYVDLTQIVLDNGSVTVDPPPQYICGDANGNGVINVVDLNYLVAYFFLGGAPPPDPIARANVNCSEPTPPGLGVNVVDLNYLVAYFFLGGQAPCAACPVN